MISGFGARAAAMLAGFALLLSGCFMTPGRFASTLEVTGPDTFAFSYEGEIFFLGLSKLAQMGAVAETAFTPSCYDDQTFEPRECTPEEVEAQRAEWQAGAEARAAEAKKQAQQIAAFMGGIDPSDPAAAEELVKLLQRQKGWERVVHKGDGLFEVTYRITGTLSHDFMFPVIEGFPATNPFVQIVLRKGGQLRVNAPRFSAQNGDSPMGASGAMMGVGSLAGLAAMGSEGKPADQTIPEVPVIDGTFTIKTAAGLRILANNTDEGPAAAPSGGEVLTWRITPRTAQAPTALIAVAP